MVQYVSSFAQTTQKTSSQEEGIPDRHYVLRVLSGDQDAFALLVHRYHSPLFNYIYHVLHDAEQAADVLQMVFLRFYTMLPQLSLEKPLKPWLFQVAHNYCIDELRKHHRHITTLFSLLEDEQQTAERLFNQEDVTADIETICEQHELQACLQRAIMALSIKPRAVVLLRYTSNMTFAQIGTVLNMPEQTAKTYFSRARKILRYHLANDGILSRYG